jgi:hypothetical protein
VAEPEKVDTVAAAAAARFRTTSFKIPTPSIMVRRYKTPLTIASEFYRRGCDTFPYAQDEDADPEPTMASTRTPLKLAFPAKYAGRWMPGLFPDQDD